MAVSEPKSSAMKTRPRLTRTTAPWLNSAAFCWVPPKPSWRKFTSAFLTPTSIGRSQSRSSPCDRSAIATGRRSDECPRAHSLLSSGVFRQKNPQPLADAIFPIMGPAIRKAISTALSGMVQNFNQTLTHSMSAQGLSWRWEALRTGRSFSEVVLVRTLLFRVEQVFLIHKETGLLLCQVSAPNAAMQDADMVSGMDCYTGFRRRLIHHPKRRRAGNVTSRRIKCLDRTGTAGNSSGVIRGMLHSS